MKEIRWGIIGCGDVCEIKSGPAFSKVEHSELLAVMRRNAEKAEDYAHRHNVPKWYSDADELINDPEVNAVYIATPPNMHAHYVKKVAQAGKAVYVEKPMGRNYAECKEMIQACQKAEVPLFVAYYRRRLPYFLKIKELIDTKAIGKITLAQINLIKSPKPGDKIADKQEWRIKPDISGGGYFHDLASHQLDLIAYLLGDIEEAKGIQANVMGYYAAADTVTATFRCSSGVLGSGSWTFTSIFQHYKDEITLTGDQGKITFCTFNGNIPIVLETKFGRDEFHLPYPPHVQQPLIQTIVDELRGEGICPSTGYSGAKTNLVMDRILQ